MLRDARAGEIEAVEARYVLFGFTVASSWCRGTDGGKRY